MKTDTSIKLIASIIFCFVYSIEISYGCSLVKITSGGRTVVGNNEDYWDPDTRIWFEQGKNIGFGAVYVGYSYLIPEGGMNEKGLMFDGFAVSYKAVTDTFGKKRIPETELKKKIMQECSLASEVKNMISRYNITFWSNAVWVFVDKTGNYLIVDGDSLILANREYFVQTNFHTSAAKNENMDCWRYKKAMAILGKNFNSSVDYCTSIMDSVHQVGTRYSTVYDLSNSVVYLYYCHDYKKFVRFDLKEELTKGEQILIMPQLFLENKGAYNYYINNLLVKNITSGLKNEEVVHDSLKILEIKSLIKETGNPFLAELYINDIGYDWLKSKKNSSNAIIVFKINVELFAQSSNAYDSLGEAYMENKQYRLALDNYKRSVELNQENSEGKQRIKLLQKLLEEN